MISRHPQYMFANHCINNSTKIINHYNDFAIWKWGSGVFTPPPYIPSDF